MIQTPDANDSSALQGIATQVAAVAGVGLLGLICATALRVGNMTAAMETGGLGLALAVLVSWFRIAYIVQIGGSGMRLQTLLAEQDIEWRLVDSAIASNLNLFTGTYHRLVLRVVVEGRKRQRYWVVASAPMIAGAIESMELSGVPVRRGL